MGDIKINLEEIQTSASNLLNSKGAMEDEMNSLDAKMGVVRDMVSQRLRNDIEYFGEVRGKILNSFAELETLKQELDAAVEDFLWVEGGSKLGK